VRQLTRLLKESKAEDELLLRFYLRHPTALIGIMKIGLGYESDM
jgi:hypothetical protein